MDHVLYVSHCVPNPPDKGEKIRAHHIVRNLARRYRVHVAAFAKSEGDVEAARGLAGVCESVYTVPLSPRWSLVKAAFRFAAGRSLMMSYYRDAVMTAYCHKLAERVPLVATVAFSTAMAQYAPGQVPLLLDMTDVDSEKWFQYAALRFPGPVWAMEGRRLRQQEIHYARRAAATFLATRPEAELLSALAPEARRVGTLENGVDLEYFNPGALIDAPGAPTPRRPFALFVGAMDYYPNVDGACWFAEHVVPLVARHTDFVIAGRDPARRVRRLQSEHVTVTGSIPDVRPYLTAASVVVAPLRLARGIQNKVLEALAMGKTVLASPEICKTFGAELPEGVVGCATPEDYARQIPLQRPQSEPAIRAAAAARFRWSANVEAGLFKC